MKIATRAALALAVSGALAAVPVAAGPRGHGHGYNRYYGGYNGGYNRYYGGYNGGYYPGRYRYRDNGGDVAAALIGGLLVGGIVAAAASSANNNRAASPPRYAPQTYPQQGYQQPGYQQPAYQPEGYQPQGYQPQSIASSELEAEGDAAPVQGDAETNAATRQVELCSRAAERTAQNGGGMARVVSIESIDGSEANAEVRGTLEISQQQTGAVNRAAFVCTASYTQVTGVRMG